MGLIAGDAGHGNGELAGGEAVDGGDFAGQRAERGDLDVLLVGGLLEVSVVLLERVVVGAQLVEAGGLDEHPGVGAGETGDGEHADHGGGHEGVGVLQRNGNLVQVSFAVAAHNHDVVALFEAQTLT